MTSTRKTIANRLNARKSTGPRTMAGKTRASRNALRHGFSAIALASPALDEKVDRVATMICKGQSDSFVREQAHIIAESEILLMRIRAARVAGLEFNDNHQQLGHSHPADQTYLAERYPERGNRLAKLRAALPVLLSLERYERRAISRRRNAIRSLSALRFLSADALSAQCSEPE